MIPVYGLSIIAAIAMTLSSLEAISLLQALSCVIFCIYGASCGLSASAELLVNFEWTAKTTVDVCTQGNPAHFSSVGAIFNGT